MSNRHGFARHGLTRLRVLRLGVLPAGFLVWALVLPAFAGKPEVQAPPLAVAGHTVEIAAGPSLADLEPGSPRSEGGVWTHTLEMAGATFIRPHFVDVSLQGGDTLVVRMPSGRVIETFRGRGFRDRGTFWGLSTPGDRLVLELRFRNRYARPPFTIDRVIAGDADLFPSDPPDDRSFDPSAASRTVCLPPDYDDAICFQNDPVRWANIRASTGIMLAGGNPAFALFCSGANVSPLGYVLTNNHCLEDQAACDNAEILFGYRRTSCNQGAAPATDWQSFHCGEVVISSPFLTCEPTLQSLDFTLVSVDGDPSSTYGAVRPDATPLVNGEALYIVQHPSGRPQEVAAGSDEDVRVEAHVLRYTGTLDTEPGSSGSPIFRESDGKLVALHHCGTCDGPEANRGMLMTDIQPLIAPFLCTDSLQLQGVRGGVFEEVAGNGNGRIDPGETWQVRLKVLNASCSQAAQNVTAQVALGAGSAPGLTLLTTSLAIPNLPALGTMAAPPIVFEVGTGATCGGAVTFDLLDLQADGAGPFPDTTGVAAGNVGEILRTTLFYDSFTSGLPGAWSIVDGGTGTGAAATWTSANPGLRMEPMAEPFAIVDSDENGIGQLMDEQLISPLVSAAGYSHLELQFTHDFNWYELGFEEIGDVDIRSSATGNVWTNVRSFAGDDANGTLRLDVSNRGAGTNNVQVRFHYHDARFEWWWAVDDVFLLGHNGYTCEPFDALTFLFSDGFETGDVSRWSAVIGPH